MRKTFKNFYSDKYCFLWKIFDFFRDRLHIRPVKSDETEVTYMFKKKSTFTGFKSDGKSDCLPIEKQNSRIDRTNLFTILCTKVSKIHLCEIYCKIIEPSLAEL